ncbi:MAG: aldo/keto reductase [Candidatus Brocadia sinica]|nr:aldo/keto reductase [Candidatus Brocadia sinica]NUO03981.1 aldo/keto reductase [Candidatus Brocadia sinica]
MTLKKNNFTNRRNFLKGTFTVALGLSFTKNLHHDFPVDLVSFTTTEDKDEGVPKRRLGKTDKMVSILCAGGYHIGRMQDERYAIRMIHAALDEGVNFFDSAWSYNKGDSERRLGKALKDRRNEAFIMTKSRGRDKTVAMNELHESLKRLQTEYLDLWQFHDVQTMEDVDTLFREKGAIETALQAKQEGKILHVGFTGHRNPTALVKIIQKYHHLIETVQIPVNLVDPHYLSFILQVVPEAVKYDIGILAMKTVANGVLLEDNVASVKECLYFAWSQPISSLVSGMDSIEQLKENVTFARQFKNLSEKDQSELLARTGPFGGIKREFYKHPSDTWRIYPTRPLH